jgi:ParB/Sulfiredoxin domain
MKAARTICSSFPYANECNSAIRTRGISLAAAIGDRRSPPECLVTRPLRRRILRAFPMLSDDELQALAADIKENGLRHPLPVVWVQINDDGEAEPMLIDGRNRREAYRLAKLEPTFELLNARTWSSASGARTPRAGA